MNVTELLERLRRDATVTLEARETYEARVAQLRRDGAFVTAARLRRSSLAELTNPDTPGYGGSRERKGRP